MSGKPCGDPERLFHTGRSVVAVILVFAGLFWTFCGLFPVLAQLRDREAIPLLGGAALALAMLALGGAVMAGTYLMVFLREALAIYPQGVQWRDWRGRQTFIPWSELEGMVTGPPTLLVEGVSRRPAGGHPLYLIVGRGNGESARLEVARLGSRAAYEEITSVLSAHADLEYIGDTQQGSNPGETAWRKRSAVTDSGTPAADLRSSAPASAEAKRIADRPAFSDPTRAPGDTATGAAIAPYGVPERVFHTGRTTQISFLSYFGAIWALFGIAVLFVVWAGQGEKAPSVSNLTPTSRLAAVGWVMVLGGIAVSGVFLLSYVRSALVVHFEGLLFRDWRGRQMFIPWPDLEGIVVTYALATATSGATPHVKLFLVKRGDDATARVKVAEARQWEPLFADITSTLTERAALEYVGRDHGEETWRKRAAGSNEG